MTGVKAIVILGGHALPDNPAVSVLRLGVVELPRGTDVKDFLVVPEKVLQGLRRFAAENGVPVED